MYLPTVRLWANNVRHCLSRVRKEGQGGEPDVVSVGRCCSELESSLRREDEYGSVEHCSGGALGGWVVVLDIEDRLDSQFSTCLPQQCASRRRLLATPKNRPLVRGQPDPSLVAIVVVILSTVVGHAKRCPSPDILEHPFSNHGLRDGVYNSCAILGAVARLRLRIGVLGILSILSVVRCVGVVRSGRQLMPVRSLMTIATVLLAEVGMAIPG
jgi:hypothetical protein